MAEHAYFDLGRPLGPSSSVVVDNHTEYDDMDMIGKTPPRSPADRLKHLKKVGLVMVIRVGEAG